MNTKETKVDVLAVMDDEIASLPLMAAWAVADASEAIRRMTAARAAVAELMERDRIATEVFTCILRGVNDLNGSMGHRSEPFVSGWLQQWARSMHIAGFKPINPEARDISSALARIGGAK